MIAWYSDQQILAIDGLTSDYQYNNEITKLGVNEYLKSKDVNYYLGYCDDDNIVEIISPLYKRTGGFLKLQPVNKVKDILHYRDDLGKLNNWSLCKIIE